MAGLLTDLDTDLRAAGNQFIVDFGGLFLYQKVLAQYLTSEEDSELILIAKSAGVCVALSWAKKLLAKRGVNLNIF